MRSLLILWFVFTFPLSIFSQELEKILEAHYKASAQDKLGKVETIVTSGKNSYAMADIGSSFRMFKGRPNKIRIEGEFQGSKVIQTYDGETGWMFAPAMGIPEPKEMKGEELETILNQSDFGSPLWNYEEKGNSVELVGVSEDGSADHLKLTTAKNELNFYIDKESHLISSIRSIQVIGGAETEIEVVLMNYKSVKGIPIAQQVVTKMNGEVVTTVDIERVEYNLKLDASLFEKPSSK